MQHGRFLVRPIRLTDLAVATACGAALFLTAACGSDEPAGTSTGSSAQMTDSSMSGDMTGGMSGDMTGAMTDDSMTDGTTEESMSGGESMTGAMTDDHSMSQGGGMSSTCDQMSASDSEITGAAESEMTGAEMTGSTMDSSGLTSSAMESEMTQAGMTGASDSPTASGMAEASC